MSAASTPSATYRTLALALATRTPLSCRYGDRMRVICPIILGHGAGTEMALVFQIGGDTSRGPLRSPQWKCLRVAAIGDLAIADARWQSGRAHRHAQHCVDRVDYDINPDSRYAPRHSLGPLGPR